MSGSETDPLMAACRGLPGVTEDVKWGDNLVFSVVKKMFAVFQLPDADSISMKVDAMTFDALVQRPGIQPAPYLARHGWIHLTRDALPPEVVIDLLEGSYGLVAARLPKRTQRALGLD